LGVLNSPCLITPSRVTLLQVNHDDILNMWERLHPRFRAGAKWYINAEVEQQLDKLAFTSNAATTEMMSPYVNYRPDGVMAVKGRPVVVTEFNEALGTVGDILLANFDDYLFWEKGAVEAAMSIHVQFLTDQTAFRFITRYDGQTALASALTPYKGTNTVSPFVALATTT
jgi:HK97 family phage major capsid protein